MGIGGSELNLPSMLLNQESQRIVNDGRQQDQQKQKMQMDQMQQMQKTIQGILQQQQMVKTPVNNEISGKLMQMSARDQEQAQVKQWQDKFETNMQIAEALAPTDHVMAAEYRKEALGYKSMATNYAKEVLANKKDQAKDEGATLNVMWQSPEGYATGMENLRQVNPELASKLEQKYPQGLTLGAAREIQAEANSRMSIEQQQSKTIAIQKVMDDREAKQERLSLEREKLDEKRREFAIKRDEAASKKSETKTKEERQNGAYVKIENALIKEYDNDYDSLSKEYRKTKLAFDKAVGPDKDPLRADLQEIVDKQAQLGRSHTNQLEKAKADAIAQGATHPRLFEESRVSKPIVAKVAAAYSSAIPGISVESVMQKYKATYPKASEADIIEAAKKNGDLK